MAESILVDRYRILRRLGGHKGCLAFEAAGADGTRVALKLLEIDASLRGDEALLRFRREGEVLARLAHPGIVRLLDRGEGVRHAWIALELLRGPTLTAGADTLAPTATLACIDAMLDALSHLHSHGVVHRDLKPANVVMDAHRGPVLCDFGIARLEHSLLTQSGELLGTPAYMAPECFLGQTWDARSDLFSAGVIAYELLTGRLPFDGANSGEIMLAIMQEPTPRASRWNPAVPPALDGVLAGALAKSPHRRFASAQSFREALRAVTTGSVRSTL